MGERLRLLVRELAAERSGCRWCLDRVRHDWRSARLPMDLLADIGRHETAPAFTEPERAALDMVETIARARDRAGDALTRLRRHFSERAAAELIACMADHHLLTDEYP